MRPTSLCVSAFLISYAVLADGWHQRQASASRAPDSQAAPVGQGATAPSVKAPNQSVPSKSLTRTLDWADVIEAEVDPAVVTDAGFRDAIKATGLPWRVRDKVTNIEMLLIPPGEFVMGKSRGDDLAMENELPAHEVILTRAFYLGRYEVTQQQYALVTKLTPSRYLHPPEPTIPTLEDLMADGATKSQAEKEVSAAEEKSKSWIARQQQPAPNARGNEWPVERVSWTDCDRFCTTARLRLPTEAEWEYACRAGTSTPTYTTLRVAKIAWYYENSWITNAFGEKVTRAVGTKEANALGLHDMIGNVSEWVNDWYGEYTVDAQTDPKGPTTGTNRVVRGGNYFTWGDHCRASSRANHTPTYTGSSIGFRVARTP